VNRLHTSQLPICFTPEKIADNSQELLNAIMKAKPSSSKGTYLKGISMASTMSPGIAIDTKAFIN
jgi:large subunit ribosomal protein L1